MTDREKRLAYLRAMFRHYADVDFLAASAPLYARIASEICDDDEVLSIAIETLPGQPAVNLLFAAAHYLLLEGVAHPLRDHYADLTPGPLAADGAGAQFREFCLTHRDAIESLVRTRRVQTNVLERCGSLLPAFGEAAAILGARELAMIEVGASAGLNLLWDRYHYDYGASSWGDPASPVQLTIEVRDGHLALPDADLRAAWRAGVDLDPVDLADDDALLWQRALMWPERLDRQQRLAAATPILREVAPAITRGDACEVLPSLLQEAPVGLGLVVFASYALYQFPAEARDRLIAILREHSQRRRLVFVTMDTRRVGDPFGTVDLTLFEDGATTTRTVSTTHPHGAWIEPVPGEVVA